MLHFEITRVNSQSKNIGTKLQFRYKTGRKKRKSPYFNYECTIIFLTETLGKRAPSNFNKKKGVKQRVYLQHTRLNQRLEYQREKTEELRLLSLTNS